MLVSKRYMFRFVGALICAWAAISQAQSPSRPQFEVASLKPSAPTAPGEPIAINLGTYRNGRMTLGNVTLSDCIKYAYGIISDDQIAGPDWTKGGTVRLRTPRSEIDRRVATVRATMKRGATFRQAFCALPGE